MKIKRILALVLSLAMLASVCVFATDGSGGDGDLNPGVPLTYAITVDPTDGCTVAGTADLSAIPSGTTVTLTANVTDETKEFEKWQKKVDGTFTDVADEDATWDITVTENIEVKAIIKPKTVNYTITVDPTDGCTVAATDSLGTPIADLSAIASDTVVTLTATVTDSAVNEFDKWQKKIDGTFTDVAGEDATWDITVTENVEVKALIRAKTPSVTAPIASVVTISFETETVKYDDTQYVVTKDDKTTVIGSHDPSITADTIDVDEIIVPGSKIYVRAIAADPTDATLWTEIALPARLGMAYTEGITHENASYGGASDGKIHNLYAGMMEYSSTQDSAWKLITGETLFYLAPDTYYIRMCATPTAFASESMEIIISREGQLVSNNNQSGVGDKYYSQNGNYGMSSSAPVAQPQQNGAAKATFADIETHWAKASIVRAVEKGMFNGVAENTFDPEGTTTRGMIITIIARMNGVDLSDYTSSSFADVAAGEWYAAAVEWGNEKGIVTGTGEASFEPNGLLTREQIATIIYRYAAAFGKDTSAKADISGFADYGSVSEYALEALAWANSAGIVNGSDGNRLNPQGTATRAEVATMLMRYLDNVE